LNSQPYVSRLQPYVPRLQPYVPSGISYCLTILDPDIGELQLANGTSIAWLRYSGWMVTCPVLLMFLTAMTTYGGNKPPVRLVPLLIANQVASDATPSHPTTYTIPPPHDISSPSHPIPSIPPRIPSEGMISLRHPAHPISFDLR